MTYFLFLHAKISISQLARFYANVAYIISTKLYEWLGIFVQFRVNIVKTLRLRFERGSYVKSVILQSSHKARFCSPCHVVVNRAFALNVLS